ncbi:MAG: MFS transporter [Acidobacteria bacterium]|jgi:MFS family permease|nr:MAG: MFS transporter [Acidobacteriota bacterium]GIU82225.1 MAG: MFS transporter [Pyrinomonadaceae bacterium]
MLERYKKLPRNVFILSFVSLLNDISSDIIYPLLPIFLTITLGASPFAIGLIEGMAESASSLLKLFSGYLSDKFQRRKQLVFAGYSLSAMLRPLLAFTTNWLQVLVLRVSDRLGKGLRAAPRDALLSMQVPVELRGIAFGFHRAADNLGAVLGPLLASALILLVAENKENPSAADYQKIFLMASVPAIIAVLAIWFFVQEETNLHENEKKPVRLSLEGFDANFKRFLFAVSLFTLSNSTDAFLLLKAQQVGVSTASLPILWMCLNISKVITSLIGGEISDKLGRKKVILSGWILYALVYLGFGFATDQTQIWALFFLYGFYFGFTEGVERALVADLVPKEKRGTAYGLYAFAFSITVFPASIVFGLLWQTLGSQWAFVFSACLSLSASALLLTVKSVRNH